METTCLKLSAKRKMLKNNLRFFIVGALPFFTIILLTLVNYYFINNIKIINFSFIDFISPYNETIRLSIIVFLIFFSFCFWKLTSLFSQNFFFQRSQGNKVHFFKSIRTISFSQYNSFLGVAVIKFLLSVSFFALYFLPCIVVAGLLIYSYRYENYGYNVNLTLFVSSAILFVIGGISFFITLKRYSFSTYILLTQKTRNPLKIMAESIELAENRCLQYSLYCLSFFGWVLSCVFVIPIFYAIPYISLCKWCYVCHMNKKKKEEIGDKPIIFYIRKRVENE